MAKRKSMYEHVACISLGPARCKLIFYILLGLKEGVPFKMLSNAKFQQEFTENIVYDIGYWNALLKEKGQLLAEVEIVMPAAGQYLQLEDHFSSKLKKKYKMKCTVGRMIVIENRDLNTNIKDIERAVSEFSKMNIHNN
jgi:hypothetical protein